MPIEITMPALSPTMTEGNLAKWVKKEGDKIKSGEVIAEIETDKATMEVEAVDEGILGRIVVPAGTEGVKVNAVIALIQADGEDKKALDAWKPKVVEAPKVEAAPAAAASAAPVAATAPVAASVAPVASKAPAAPVASTAVAAPRTGGRVKASPLAKRIAAQKHIDLSSVIGSGPGGRVVRADVENYTGASGGGAVRRNAVEFVQVPNNSMRKVIARRLLESKQQVPHFYLTVEVELDAMMEARAQLNAHATAKAGKEAPAYKLSVNDMVIKAVALAMRDKPNCNVSWYDDAIIQYNNVDVSVAVATDGGLITPIVRNADQKSLSQISNEMKDLAGRARANKLKPEEFQGGGFSISNLGMYGVKTFQAIINPPQACILAVGAGETKLVMRGGVVKEIQVMNATLSVDHRAVDGALGAEFLQVFKRYMEQPLLMFV
jgi:pyruvate dehydrogenase E2 component (dihydrolipoamide acetyltransferase)